MGSLPEEPGNDLRPPPPHVLASEFAEKVRRLKRELTADLYLRRGKFWDAVSDMRERWEVEAVARLPELRAFSSYPDNLPDDYREQWQSEIDSIRKRVIPPGMRQRDVWLSKFLTACVVYDPPERPDLPGLGLLEFAQYDDPQPLPLSDPNPEPPPEPEEFLKELKDDLRRAKEEGYRTRSKPEMQLPPVVCLRDPDEVEEVGLWLWRRTLEELVERFIEPLGLDVGAALDNALRSSGVMGEYRQRISQLAQAYYIVVDQYTSEEDVESARRLIRATQERNAPGRPRQDPLIAVVCALLHDKYNEREPSDRRFWRWTHPRLSEEFSQFGVGSKRSAEGHVNLGRKLLKNRRT